MKIPDALRRLRNAMKISQEHLARRLDLSLRTIARYESGKSTPSGAVLLHLANLAVEHDEDDLATQFRFLYLDEAIKNLGFNMIVDKSGSPPTGYLVIKLDGQQQIDDVIDLLNKWRGPDPATDAIRADLNRKLFGYKGGE